MPRRIQWAVLAVALSGLPPAATAQSRDAVLEAMDARVGGVWVATVPQEMADGRPFRPSVRYEWVLDGRVLQATMTWLYEDGTTRESWRAFSAYHPGRDEVVHWSVWSSGMVIEGVHGPVAGHRLDFTVHWPEGTPPGQPTRWYSIEHRIDADTYREEAFYQADGAWMPASDLTYRRRRDGAGG